MMKVVFVLAVAIAATQATLELETEWAKFLEKSGRQYASQEEVSDHLVLAATNIIVSL